MGVRVSVGPEGSIDFFGLADQQRPESKFHSSVFEGNQLRQEPS